MYLFYFIAYEMSYVLINFFNSNKNQPILLYLNNVDVPKSKFELVISELLKCIRER